MDSLNFENSVDIIELSYHEMHLGMNSILKSAQNGITPTEQRRLIENLFSLYQKVASKENFLKEFVVCLSLCFTQDKYNAMKETLKFFAKYVTYHFENSKERDTFFSQVIYFSIHGAENDETFIRLRICKFLTYILENMGRGVGMDEKLFTKLANAMLVQLRDKTVSVRLQSIDVLTHLQDPHSRVCPIVKALGFHMEFDPSPEVRAKIVCSLAFTPRTLTQIYNKIEDKNEIVRKQALKALGRLKLVRFSLKQKQTIFTVIFQDSSYTVQAIGQKCVLEKWIKDSGCNVMAFLKHIEVISFKFNQKLLYCLFGKLPVTKVVEQLEVMLVNKVIPIHELKPENVIFWKCLVSFIYKNHLDLEDVMERITCDPGVYIKYLLKYLVLVGNDEEKAKQFILCQLLELASLLSFPDEKGKEELKKVCINLLKSDKVSITIIDVLVKSLRGLIPTVELRLRQMAEIVSDIREPMDDPPFPFSQSPPVEEEIEEVGDRIANLRFSSQSQNLDELESEIRDDPDTVKKYLTIIREFLRDPDVKKLDETLLTLKQHVIEPCLRMPGTDIARLTLDILTLMALRSNAMALQIFNSICIKIFVDSLSVSATEAVFDLLCVFGFDLVQPNYAQQWALAIGDEGIWPTLDDFVLDDSLDTLAKKRMVPFLTFLLKCTDFGTRIVACFGLCKLFLVGFISSHIVLARLTIFWFEHFSEINSEVRESLCSFFSSMSEDKPFLLIQSFVPALKNIYKLEEEQNSENVDPKKVVRLYITLLSPTSDFRMKRKEKEKCNWHWLLCEEMLNNLYETNCGMLHILGKFFEDLELNSEDDYCVDELLLKLTKIIKIASRLYDKKTVSPLLVLKLKLETLFTSEPGSDDKTNLIKDYFPNRSVSKGLENLIPETSSEESDSSYSSS